MNEIVDERNLISPERAVRGAVKGALVAAGVALVIGGGYAILNATEPGALWGVIENPIEVVKNFGVIELIGASVGAVINAFRPTARLLNRFLENIGLSHSEKTIPQTA